MGAVPFDRQTRNVRVLDEQSVAGANGPCGDEIASGRLAAGQRQLRRDSLRSRLLFFVGRRRRRRVLAKNEKIKCYWRIPMAGTRVLFSIASTLEPLHLYVYP